MNLKRATCGICQRPLSTCICRWIAPVQSTLSVLLLQHPMETTNAKNTARLLHLSLPGSTLAVGEQFDEEALRALLDGPRRPVLLYPDTPGDASLGIAPAPPFDPAWADQAEDLLLVVLDATWRKSRKMLYLNPLLQALPRLALRDVPASQYHIRKAHAPGQLSTFEATVHALAQIEGIEARYAPLLAAFDGFIGQQQALMQPA
ncbi:tRNA-uridine aminocarboxypropyltransferase [Pseudoduganella plicata]|nr:tRNA-uridine aminocarboxypropyltransferase [Pseudoduganella plicata]QBQ36096.1 DTW domain-containing protein [Pseudoduganella plicata]